LEEHCVVVWERVDVVAKIEVKRDYFVRMLCDGRGIRSEPAVGADPGVNWNRVVG
jgi:hypothetical protein